MYRSEATSWLSVTVFPTESPHSIAWRATTRTISLMKNTITIQFETAGSGVARVTDLLALPHADRLRLLGDPRGIGDHQAAVVTVRVLVRSVSSSAVDQG